MMTKRPSSIELPDLWERDGSLRDAYVFGTSEADWISLLEIAREHQAVYFFEGTERPLPQPSTIFSNREEPHLLRINLGGIHVHCHFFVSEEIELDIDPRQIVDESHHEMVLALLEELARKTRKPLILAPENTPESPFLSFDPQTGRWTVRPAT